jgi:DNA end-binding protein Ku
LSTKNRGPFLTPDRGVDPAVSIPVELYSAIEDHNIRFHLPHKKCGSRVRNQLFCPICKVVIERDETVRGYEVTKNQYVRGEDTELEALETEANSSINMREFIPIEKIDPIYFESSYISRPTKGADKHRSIIRLDRYAQIK